MRIAIITPAPQGSRHGNRTTALRWSRHLQALGHRVSVMVEWDGRQYDLLIALHARRSHGSLNRWKLSYPDRPLVLVLTGTDLYRDIRSDDHARKSLEIADRIVVLQPKGLAELEPAMRAKARVIFQSVRPVRRQESPRSYFLVTVIGHLRDEKDPFRTAYALNYLPADSRIRVVHLGRAVTPEMESEARELMRTDPRYRWIGEHSHAETMRWLARSHVMVISSRMEGGAHVVSEAIAIGVPVIASDIAGNIGLLGEDYQGYYPVGDQHALAAALTRAEFDQDYLVSLETSVKACIDLVSPESERSAVSSLLTELVVDAESSSSRASSVSR